jgi:hypothetical protein
LDVTSLDSFGKLVIGCRTFPSEYSTLSFSFKGLSKFSISKARANASKPLSFEWLFVVQFTPGIYNQILGCLLKGLCYYLESQESKSYITQSFTDPNFGKDLKQV